MIQNIKAKNSIEINLFTNSKHLVNITIYLCVSLGRFSVESVVFVKVAGSFGQVNNLTASLSKPYPYPKYR